MQTPKYTDAEWDDLQEYHARFTWQEWDEHAAEVRRQLGGRLPLEWLRKVGSLPLGLPKDPGDREAWGRPAQVVEIEEKEIEEEETPW